MCTNNKDIYTKYKIYITKHMNNILNIDNLNKSFKKF